MKVRNRQRRIYNCKRRKVKLALKDSMFVYGYCENSAIILNSNYKF